VPDRIRGVLFDKDGTLFDFAVTWRAATRALLARLAPDDAALQRDLGRAVGFDPATGVFEANSIIVAGAADQVAAVWAQRLPGFDAARLEAAANSAATAIGGPTLSPATDDLPGLLSRLRDRGLALGVATHDSETAARAHLAAVGALQLFDFIAGYDSGWGMKPGPGMVLAFADAARIAPHQIVMVGDSLHDMGAARAAGAWAVGVLTGPAGRDDLAPHADAVLPSIAALPEWLAGRAARPAHVA
jgi:phosphoglycolate phosphatase